MLKGTFQGLSGRKVFVQVDGDGNEKDADGKEIKDKPVVRTFLRSDAGPLKVLKGPDKLDAKEPAKYAEAHATDLVKGQRVRLHGPPTADLHTVSIVTDAEEKKPAKASAHAPHASHGAHK